MRPSSRLLVPALTILCWSFESVYASVRPPGQGLYKRHFRTADFSTSIRPSSNPSNGAKSPETDTSSAPRSGSDAPQTSAKTKRSSPYHENLTYSKASDGSYPGHDVGTYLDAQRSRRGPLSNSAGDKLYSMYARDTFHKRTTSFATHHKSGTNDHITSHSLDNRERKQDNVRRSAPIDLNTLHIARGIRNSWIPPVDKASTLSDSKVNAAVNTGGV